MEDKNAVEIVHGAGRPFGAPVRTDMMMREVIKHAVSLGQINEQQGEALFWLHGYGIDKRLSNADLSRKLNVADSTVSSLFSGKYEAQDWTPMIKKIETFRQVEDDASRKLNLGFVETATAKQIFSACNSALIDGMPAFIYGASHIGKTTALLEFQRRNNHGRTKYIRLGSRWSKTRFVHELAIACKISRTRNKRGWELEYLINESLNRYNLLIVDEFHLAFETVSEVVSKELVEYIREVYDRTHCGLVLSSTKVGLDDLENGKNKMLFDQLRRRGVVKVVLPDVPPVRDINAIARHFGLELPTGEVLKTVKEILRTRGLGVFVTYLQKAHSLAGEKQMTWDNFFYVNDGYAKLACQKDEY